MASAKVEKIIKAPVERVFELATDLRNAPGRISRILKMEVLTEGPVGTGTRFRETRKIFGKEHTEEMEITEFESPARYVVKAESAGCLYRTEFLFSPEGDGTKLVMSFEATPVTLAAKLMAPMMKSMMGSVVKECDQDLEDIKTAAESSGASAGGSR